MEYDPEDFHHFIDDFEVEVVKKGGSCANQIPKDPNIFERNDFVITIINDFIEEKKLTVLEIREMIKAELTVKIGDVRRQINGNRPFVSRPGFSANAGACFAIFYYPLLFAHVYTMFTQCFTMSTPCSQCQTVCDTVFSHTEAAWVSSSLLLTQTRSVIQKP